MVNAATTRSTSFFSKDSGNTVVLQDRLNRAASEAEHLATAFRQKIVGVKWQSALLGVAGHYEHDGEWPLTSHAVLLSERLQAVA